MYIGVGKGEKTENTGSCAVLVNYLEKENKEALKENKETKELSYFFNQDRDQVQAREVVQTIDQNIQKLGKVDAKYFMVTISPSEKELRHIQNNRDELRGYARAVMEEYALAFNRGIGGDDLVYFGKIEEGRKFTGADQAVQLGLVPAGSPKPGLHTHVHIIVSRKDKTQRLKLSPETNHRANKNNFQGGFDKVKFFLACEKAFDKRFSYMRTLEESFAHRREKLNSKPSQSINNQQIQQVQAAIGKALRNASTLLSFTQALLEQRIRPVFEKDATGKVIGMNYELISNHLSIQQGGNIVQGGKIILSRDEAGRPALSYQLKRQVGSKIAQRPISPHEQAQLLNQGYTDYLTGFISRQGKPFAARLYFSAQNELKFSFNVQVPKITTPAPWTHQECKAFVFPPSYLGTYLTPAIKKQLIANQASEFIPKLITRHKTAKSPQSSMISEKDLGPGFEFSSISKKMDQVIQSYDVEQVERFLAQHRSQRFLQTAGPAVNRPLNPATHQQRKLPSLSPSPSSFLQKIGHKLGFSQPEEETTDNRLDRLKKRRKRRKVLTLER